MRRAKAFTLIELLVVIAVIALLMAILLPSLQGAKKQAQAVACQARLRQWSLICSTYVSDNNGKFFGYYEFFLKPQSRLTEVRPREPNEFFGWRNWSYEPSRGTLFFCPVATKLRPWQLAVAEEGIYGDKSSPWAYISDQGQIVQMMGSYGVNLSVFSPAYKAGPDYTFDLPHLSRIYPERKRDWKTCLVRGTANIPVLLDARLPMGGHLTTAHLHQNMRTHP